MLTKGLWCSGRFLEGQRREYFGKCFDLLVMNVQMAFIEPEWLSNKKYKQKIRISKQRLVLSLFVSLVTGTNPNPVCIILNLHLFIAVHNLFSKRFAPINKNPIHLWKLTRNLKITTLKGKLIFQTFIFRFHLSFRGGGGTVVPFILSNPQASYNIQNGVDQLRTLSVMSLGLGSARSTPPSNVMGT